MTNKEEKYDRQIRLWGTHGQSTLEKAAIACLGASAATTETLKNLVLPGCGEFIIVDNGIVENQDVGNNFFVTISSVGEPKAKTCCDLLQELNSDVSGSFLKEDPCKLIDEDIQWFDRFSVVVVTHLPSCSLQKLSSYLYPKNIPLIHIISVGFIGSLRIQVKEHSVIESKPDNSLQDLRITAPWPELKEYFDNIDLEALDDTSHAHIPYIVILYQSLQEWKSKHDGNGPQSYKEKQAFKVELMRKKRGEAEGNFIEAYNEAKNAWLEPSIPSSIELLFQSPNCTDPSASPFWLCVLALKQFAEDHAVLPLSGSLPDMSADTLSYQKIQSLYREKAAKDAAEMKKNVATVCHLFGRPVDFITPEYISLVCKNAYFLVSISTSSIASELESNSKNGALLQEAIDDDMFGTPKWYIIVRAYLKFQEEYNRAPGDSDALLQQDALTLQKYGKDLCKKLEIPASFATAELAQEFCRFGGMEIHTTSAALGGIAAQEIIKLLTCQLVPLDHTLLLDGMNCTTSMFKV